MKKLPEGLYEQVINQYIQNLKKIDQQYDTIPIRDAADIPSLLTHYLVPVLKKSLTILEEKHEPLNNQIERCNEIINQLSLWTGEEHLNNCQVTPDGEILLSVIDKEQVKIRPQITRPITSLSHSSLFTGSRDEPSLLQELKAEIASSDRIDMLVSFIKWSGIRLLMDELSQFCNHGRLRVITTSYIGATDLKAIEFLSQLPNTEIRISYDTERTRLHAKAYYFFRESGFSSAYVGSSNLSNPAITSGLEWNVKLTEKDAGDILQKICISFESYWDNPEFIPYRIGDKPVLKEALNRQKGSGGENDLPVLFDITPYFYQKEILEKLLVEREVHGRYRNLIVAATGTGKTIISAFDFRNFVRNGNPDARILFVAHREEILKQSLSRFRIIMRDPNFGDLCIRGVIPSQIDHCFISIQTFNSTKFHSLTPPDHYDFIIIDEFHHAAAASYQTLLQYYHPKILVGLTATPERMDNLDILGYFDGKIAAEIRLPEAIDRNLLAPFHYFGITDTIDLEDVSWSKGGYDKRTLSEKYTGNRERAVHVASSLERYVTDINAIIGLGFCVSVDHAIFMSDMFNEIGIPSGYLTGESDQKTRNSIQSRLLKGEIHFIFVVDLYNEGVDIPEVNTVLFLRPTESMTVFLQQLGRGLRICEGKECLTVLDFVGRQHSNYRFDTKFRALTSEGTKPLSEQVKTGTYLLPRGCFITLEKVARETVLAHIERSLLRKNVLIEKISRFEDDTGRELSLKAFLEYYQLDLTTLYSKSSFLGLCADAGLCERVNQEDERWMMTIARKIGHINSISFIRFIREILQTRDINSDIQEKNTYRSHLNMLYYSIFTKPIQEMGYSSLFTGFQELFKREWMVTELLSILDYLEDTIQFIEKPLNIGFECGLSLHGYYSRDQVFAGLGHYTPDSWSPKGKMEGVVYFPDKKLDVFFITLNKSEKFFSSSTMYHDYAINDTLFHWQSQSTTSESSPTGQRYIHHNERESAVLLFVREFNKIQNISQPFLCLGTARYERHSGSRPMSIVWRLDEPIPGGYMKKVKVGSGG